MDFTFVWVTVTVGYLMTVYYSVSAARLSYLEDSSFEACMDFFVKVTHMSYLLAGKFINFTCKSAFCIYVNTVKSWAYLELHLGLNYGDLFWYVLVVLHSEIYGIRSFNCMESSTIIKEIYESKLICLIIVRESVAITNQGAFKLITH